LADIAPGGAGSTPRTLVVHRGRAYFSADDSIHGRELWQSDGTPAGTRLAADLLPGSEGSDPFLVSASDSSLSVLAVDSSGLSLRELPAATDELARIAALGPGARAASSNPSSLTGVAGRICFFKGSELWISDGSEAGTMRVEAARSIRALS